MPVSLFILICILAAVYFYIRTYTIEGMTTGGGIVGGGRCPNMLIQKGAAYYLYNTKLAEVPGVNPIMFNNLEDYVEFLDWQRSQGIRCPVLYLQEVYDSQGNMTYKARPCVTDLQGGLPPTTASLDANVTQFPDQPGIPGTPLQASTATSGNFAIDPANRYPNLKRTLLVDATSNDPPYNKNSYPSYDESAYYSGKHTPLDQLDVEAESKQASPNPMDPNWGGAEYTQYLVESGYYKDNEVAIQIN
jgi:hypothetical protein